MADPDGIPLLFCNLDQPPDLPLDRFRALGMVQEHIPLCKRELEETGRGFAQGLGRGPAVDEKKILFFKIEKTWYIFVDTEVSRDPIWLFTPTR